MDKIIVPFRNIRGLGDIVSPKSLEDYETYLSKVTKDTETVNNIEMEVYSLVGNSNKISLTAYSNSVTYGNAVFLYANVTDFEDNPITGLTVSFYDGDTLLGTGTYNQYTHIYTFQTSSLTAGVHNITAKATIEDILIVSNVLSVTVNKISSSISLSGNDIEYGNNASLSGTLSIGSGYSVKIYQGNTLINTVTTGTGGAFSCTVSNLNVGAYTFSAVFEGDSTHAESQNNVSLNVYNIIPTISLASSSNNLLKGGSYTLSGTLSAGAGSVKIYNGETLVDTVTADSNGAFSKSLTNAPVNIYNYTAVFEGNANYGRCTSSNVNVKVLTTTYTELTFVGDYLQNGPGSNYLVNSNNENIIIDYGDNTIEVYNGKYTHEYSSSGTYTIKIYNATAYANYCFELQTGITSITIPEGITTIGVSCFAYDTGLTSLEIPSTVTSIGEYAFNSQSSIQSITLPWTSSSNIVPYDSLWNYSPGWVSGFKFIIPAGTTSLYTAKGYSSSLLREDVNFDGISLSSNKSILSYTDNESATLTAQLTSNGSAVSESGVTVSFEVRKQSDNSLVETLSGSTNSSGVATVSYLGKGVGDLNIKAIYGSFVSEIYRIEDCYRYDTASSDKTSSYASPIVYRGSGSGQWNYNSSNGYYGTISGSNEVMIPLNELTGEDDFTIEFDAKLNSTDTNRGIAGLCAYEDNNNYSRISCNALKLGQRVSVNGSATESESNTETSVSQGDVLHYKFTVTGNEIVELVMKGTTRVGTRTISYTTTLSTKFGFALVWSNTWTKDTFLKNIKIKPL